MATFTITTPVNIDSLSVKTGGDIYNINGGTLTIDQDSRVGLNQGSTSSLGNITLSASLGGTVDIDGRDIWMIPYTGGSGNVPSWNTVITNNTGSGKLIAVHSSLTAASTATGAAMPATGFIRVKQKTGTYSAGALSGISATATDAGRVGWIEIVGDEGATINANRLGNFNIKGAWYEVGTTNGTSNQTMQIPNNGLLRYVAGVFIETSVGSNSYEFYPNAGTTTTTGTESQRGKVVWISNTGLVRIGNSGAATNGYTPISGLKVVVGNIFLENCTTAAREANVIPNATIASRYDFTTTGGGVINIDKCNMAWYLSCSQAYSINASNSGFIDSILLSEIATPITFTNVGVGNKPTTALVVAPLSMSLCFAGGTFTDCVFMRVPTTANNTTSLVISDVDGFVFTRVTALYSALRGHTGNVTITLTRASNCTFTDLKMIDGQFSLVTTTNININNISYINGISGTTGTANPLVSVILSTNCLNTTINGYSLPVTNNHPYTSLFAINATGCKNTKIRNIGTRSAPLSLGSANACGLIYSLANGAAANTVYVQRVYCSNTRTGIMTSDNSSTKIYMDNVFGDYADSSDVSSSLNMRQRGLGTTKALTAQTSVYGTHWIDYFTSATAGRIAIVMNEPTTLTTSQVTLSNGAAFTSAGGLYMPTIGQEAIFETPYYILGHATFSNTPIVMAGGTSTNYVYEYQIDKNNGNGFSSWSLSKTASTIGTALSQETGIDVSLGFKLKLKLTTSVTNSSPITSLYLVTNTSAAAQDYQYPLDEITLKLTGLKDNTEVRIYLTSTTTELAGIESAVDGTVDNRSFSFTITAGVVVDIAIINVIYENERINGYTVPFTDTSIPVQQRFDRNYNNSI